MHSDLRLLPAFIGFATLMACTADQNGPNELEEDKSHEKSFSWDVDSGALTKRSSIHALSAIKTSFSDTTQLTQAIRGLEEKLESPSFTEGLWKPVDYACDELELALWNTYGTISLNDSVIFDEATLKSRCERSEDIAKSDPNFDSAEPSLAKSSDWRWWPEGVVSHRQHPYKMIGRSWHDFNSSFINRPAGKPNSKSIARDTA